MTSAAADAVASVTHADVTDVCAFLGTPVYELVPRVTPRIYQSTPPERFQYQWFIFKKKAFCLGLQCDGRSGVGGTAGRGEAAAHRRVRRHRRIAAPLTFPSRWSVRVSLAAIKNLLDSCGMLRVQPKGAEAQTGLRHDVLAASRWRSSWEAGCQQLTAEMGVND